METIEYRTADKTGWGAGPWQQEPDKRQWQDEATGLPCLAVRGPGGHWCGYVGVAEGHPLYRKGYSTPAGIEKATAARMIADRGYADLYATAVADGSIGAESLIDVHGGLTFADACEPAPTRESWEKWRQRAFARKDEARRYPVGDAAMLLKERAVELEDFDAFVEHSEAANVCHKPGAGEPDHVWWFGFDCAHSGDFSPKYARYGTPRHDETYKPLDYVVRECQRLAAQLASLSSASAPFPVTTL